MMKAMSDSGSDGSRDDVDAVDWESVAGVFDAVSNPARLRILRAVEEDVEMQEVADRVGMTRSGVQNHLEVLIDRELVYRPETGGRRYAVTPLGRFFSVFVEGFGVRLSEVLEAVSEADVEAREEFESLPVGEDTLERMVAERRAEAQHGPVSVLEERLTGELESEESET